MLTGHDYHDYQLRVDAAEAHGVCSCGWVGPSQHRDRHTSLYQLRGVVLADIADHLLAVSAERKENSSPPRGG